MSGETSHGPGDGPGDDGGWSLFETEERVMRRAEEMIDALDSVASGVRRLAEAYRQGYREQRRLVRLSDRMQADLQAANNQLGVQAEELRRLATTDPLTQVPNRRHLLEIGDHEAKRCRRAGTPMAVAVVDLDHFKTVNDRFGHGVGDRTLIAFVAACHGTLRETDTLGRVGGEEFAILFPDTPAPDAVEAAERLRTAVSTITVPPDAPDAHEHLTASLGIAAVGDGEEELENALGRADRALYRAKDNGRNRVELAEE